MDIQNKKSIGMTFWVGTLIFGGFIWAVPAILLGEFVIPAFAALVFCWFGGLFAQAASDILHGSRSPHFGRTIWRWVVVAFAYYTLAGFLFYWIESHIHGTWGFLLGLVIMLLPLIRLMSHLSAENARRAEKRDRLSS